FKRLRLLPPLLSSICRTPQAVLMRILFDDGWPQGSAPLAYRLLTNYRARILFHCGKLDLALA
ncbi:MAG: hypothetical protein ACREXV_17750, partial [Polaromonas sp.]